MSSGGGDWFQGGFNGGFPSRGRPQNVGSLFRFTELTERTRRHLVRVYLTLAYAVAAASLGCYLSMRSGIGGGPILPLIATLGGVPWLLSLEPTERTLPRRRAILGGVALAQGTGLAALVGTTLVLHPGVVLSSLLATLGVFVSFSGAALAFPRRSMLFLGGILGSILSGLMFARLGSMLLGGLGAAPLLGTELTLGLAVFSLYVAFDTQVIVERAESGVVALDEVRGALELFTDLFATFVRILVLLARNAEDRDERDERRDGRRRYATRSRRG